MIFPITKNRTRHEFLPQCQELEGIRFIPPVRRDIPVEKIPFLRQPHREHLEMKFCRQVTAPGPHKMLQAARCQKMIRWTGMQCWHLSLPIT